jgi:V8-like Glu-specific endopeptidase
MKIWRTSFKVKDASMLNLLFSPYQVNKGVTIYLYDRKQEVVLGAFSDINNKTFNKLATAQIPGDELIIEIQVPSYLDNFGQLGISGLGCDFTDFIRKRLLKDVFYGTSGSCNVDIHCISDPLVRELKNAVVRIMYNGTQRCTGTLVNNTRQDGAYYILTAGHCINREDEANAAVFYFDYESPYCDGPDGKAMKSLSGATLKATGDNLDFSLLELLEPIPYHYNAYYAGWDYTGKAPVSGFTIHHPNGDVKKYSQENHPISVSNYDSEYNNNTHWLVRHWDSGTTEPGSSGCPLFDKYGHIVGTLTGGYADCDNSVLDYFQMFSHSWDDFLSQNRQLACWLDPPEEGRGFLNGFDPFREFRLTGDTLSNILKNEDLVLMGDGLEWWSYS